MKLLACGSYIFPRKPAHIQRILCRPVVSSLNNIKCIASLQQSAGTINRVQYHHQLTSNTYTCQPLDSAKTSGVARQLQAASVLKLLNTSGVARQLQVSPVRLFHMEQTGGKAPTIQISSSGTDSKRCFLHWAKILLGGGILLGGFLLHLLKTGVEAKEQETSSGKDILMTGSGQTSDISQGTGEVRKITLQEAINISRDRVQRIKDETGSPGLAISVSVDGRTVWSEGLGFSDVENRLPCSPETVLRIASISKSITMTTVAKLWENGDLDLDKPIQYYLPTFPEKLWNGEKVTITTRQLLCHLSGIRHYDKDYMKDATEKDEDEKVKQSKIQEKSKNLMKGHQQKSDKMSFSQSASCDQPKSNNSKTNQSQAAKNEMLLEEYYIQKNYASVTESMELFKDDPLVHKPGTKFLYTSHGWTVVSAVVEAAAKVKFEKYLRRVLSELGMDHTYLEENDPLVYNRGRHYVKNDEGRLVNAPYIDLSYKWAGGGLISNVLDLVKFGNVMLYSYHGDSFHSNQQKSINNANFAKNNSMKNVSGSAESRSTANENHNNLLPGYLKPGTMQQMWSAVDKTKQWGSIAGGHYGLGWGVWESIQQYGCCRQQRFFVSHTGGAVGGSSVLLILPPQDEEFNSNHCGPSLPAQAEKCISDQCEQNLPQAKECSSNQGKQNRAVPKGQPQGVVVAIIVNMMSVGLNKTAFDIANIFDAIEK